jgi:CBS domain-containing protein
MPDIMVHDRNTVPLAKKGSEYYRQSDLSDNAGYPFEELTANVPDRNIVRDVMTPIVFAVRPQVPAKEVIEEMLRLHVHRLFVVGADGVLVGVIAMSDILRRLLD